MASFDDLAFAGARGPSAGAGPALCFACARLWQDTPATDRLCPACGVALRRLTAREAAAVSAASAAREAREAAAGDDAAAAGAGQFLFELLQLLGLGFAGGAADAGGGLGALGGDDDGSRPASSAAVAALPRLVLRDAAVDLPSVATLVATQLDAAARAAGALECVCVPAAFSPPLAPARGDEAAAPAAAAAAALLRADALALPRLLLAGAPGTGEGWPPAPAGGAGADPDARGCAVLFERGAISFARKALLAAAHGAAAAIVVQSAARAAEWPLTMVDGGGDIGAGAPALPPCVMMSAADGAALRRLAAVAREAGGCVRVSLSRSTAAAAECPICCEPFAVGDALVRLPCVHVFHDGCIVPWLLRRNTCPCCRLALPLDEAAAAAAAADAARADALERARRHAAERDAAAGGMFG
jgi:hypothetical protein